MPDRNPWTDVSLCDYENHMKQANVMQLQTLDAIMKEQFKAYEPKSVTILGVAGGNGLGNLLAIPSIRLIIGVDINADYLDASYNRYPALHGRYFTLLADIRDSKCYLPHADMVVANLFIEYVGAVAFAGAISRINPAVVSCVIQVDTPDEVTFVSDSPYTEKLEILESVHTTVDKDLLEKEMVKRGYTLTLNVSHALPNGKRFLRLDFTRP